MLCAFILCESDIDLFLKILDSFHSKFCVSALNRKPVGLFCDKFC